MTFSNLPVTNQKVWEYLLDEKRNNWRIVRLKTIEMNMPGQFMIVTEDDTVKTFRFFIFLFRKKYKFFSDSIFRFFLFIK